MKNLFKNIDLESIAKTFILLPILISLVVIFILYLINNLKQKNLSYLNICLKVLGCFYAVIIATFAALLTIRLKYGNVIIFKKSQSDTFNELSIFLISTFFLLMIYLFVNLINHILFKAALIKNLDISIYAILNPIAYFIFVFIFILSLFMLLNNNRFNSIKIKNNIQIVTPLRIT